MASFSCICLIFLKFGVLNLLKGLYGNTEIMLSAVGSIMVLHFQHRYLVIGLFGVEFGWVIGTLCPLACMGLAL